MRSLAAAALLFAASPAPALSTEMQAQLDFYQDSANKKAHEAVAAKQAWMAHPDFASQNKFNGLRDQAVQMFKNFDAMLASAREAERAGSAGSLAAGTVTGSIADARNSAAYKAAADAVDTLGGYISDASTRLFGASQEDLYGPNWQALNGQYKALGEKSREIRARMDKAKAKPDNEAEVQAIRAEIEGMRQRYDALRKAVRAESRNLGFAATFWGEDYMGRYIEACVEGFDATAVIMDVLTGNIKLLYDVFKPAILLKLGDWIAANATNLTPKIKDALVTDILGVGPSQVEEAVDGLKGKLIADPAKEKMLEAYKKAMKEEFSRLKKPLMQGVQAQIEKEMSDEFMAHVKDLPYDSLPGGASADLKGAAEKYFQNRAVRDKFMKKTEEGIAKEVEKAAAMNKLGYAAGKAEKLSAKLDAVGTVFDFTAEFVTLYANSPLLKASLEAADFRAKQIRQNYRDAKVDTSETTEDEYVNKVWFGEWKMLTPAGSSVAAKARAANDKDIAATTSEHKAIEKQDGANKKASEAPPSGYQPPSAGAAIGVYENLVGELERQIGGGGLKPADILAAEAAALGTARGVIGAVDAVNSKVYGEQNKKLNERVQSTLPSPGESSQAFNERLQALSLQWWNEMTQESIKYSRMSEEANKQLDEARKKRFKEWRANGERALSALQGFSEASSALSARAMAGLTAAPLGGYCGTQSYAVYQVLSAPGLFTPRDLGKMIGLVSKLTECQKDRRSTLQPKLKEVSSAMDGFAQDNERLLSQAADVLAQEGGWADLVLSGSINRFDGGSVEPGLPFVTISQINGDLLGRGQDTLRALDGWASQSQDELEKIDIDAMEQWLSDVRDYEAALAKHSALYDDISGATGSRSSSLTRERRAVLLGERGTPLNRDETLISDLISRFTHTGGDTYLPPGKKFASWVIQAHLSPEGLKKTAEDVLSPRALRSALSGEGADAVASAVQALYELDAPIRSGYRALTGPFPGFHIAPSSLLSSVSPPKISPEAKKSDQAMLHRLDNLEQGLADLSGAISMLRNDIEAHRGTLRAYYQEISRMNRAGFELAEQAINARKPADAEQALSAIKEGYPSYPSLPEGVWVDSSMNPEQLGAAKDLAADNAKRADLVGRIYLLKKQLEAPPPPQFDPAPAAVRELYSQFKDAYEARDESRVMSLLGDEWEAGDGTTLSDLQGHLHGIYGMFDQIRYNLQNLNIQRTQGNAFNVNYDITITSRIFSRNLTHEEKSSVTELVVFDGKKARIEKTLSGRFWYIQ